VLPDEFAGAAVFLASRASDFVTTLLNDWAVFFLQSNPEAQ
jgi:hypothetical protein